MIAILAVAEWLTCVLIGASDEVVTQLESNGRSSISGDGATD